MCMIMNGGYVIDNLRIKIVSVYSCFQLWVHVYCLINKNCPDKTNYRGYLALRTGLVRVIDVWCMEGNMTLWSCDRHDSHL